jgi:hypothetical protein
MAWCPVALWIVPDEAAVARLVAAGVPRGRIWITAEVLALLAIPGITEAEARRRALAKLAGDGGRPDVRRPSPAVTPEASPGWLPGLGPRKTDV